MTAALNTRRNSRAILRRHSRRQDGGAGFWQPRLRRRACRTDRRFRSNQRWTIERTSAALESAERRRGADAAAAKTQISQLRDHETVIAVSGIVVTALACMLRLIFAGRWVI
jgi:hypothetical protein